MSFSSENKALIKNLYRFKKYSYRRILTEFLKINCNREKVGLLLTEIWETRSTNQRHEIGRLKHACTEENVITVDEIVGLLNHKGQKQTYHSVCQISKETDLTKSSIVQIIHCIFGQKCILFTNMLASFSYIYILQSSVVTQLTCIGLFSNHFIANCPQNVSVKVL